MPYRSKRKKKDQRGTASIYERVKTSEPVSLDTIMAEKAAAEQAAGVKAAGAKAAGAKAAAEQAAALTLLYNMMII